MILERDYRSGMMDAALRKTISIEPHQKEGSICGYFQYPLVRYAKDNLKTLQSNEESGAKIFWSHI